MRQSVLQNFACLRRADHGLFSNDYAASNFALEGKSLNSVVLRMALSTLRQLRDEDLRVLEHVSADAEAKKSGDVRSPGHHFPVCRCSLLVGKFYSSDFSACPLRV